MIKVCEGFKKCVYIHYIAVSTWKHTTAQLMDTHRVRVCSCADKGDEFSQVCCLFHQEGSDQFPGSYG